MAKYNSITRHIAFLNNINVNIETGCWEWNKSLNGNGYAQFITIRGHIYSFEYYIGSDRANMSVCHRCDVRKCVNPFHLFLATHNENMKDGVNKGRFKNNGKPIDYSKHPSISFYMRHNCRCDGCIRAYKIKKKEYEINRKFKKKSSFLNK